MHHNNNHRRTTTVQFEPTQQQYGKTKLAEVDSMERIDMGPMMCECTILQKMCVKDSAQ